MQTAEDADVAPEAEATAAGLTMWHATHSHAVAITINFVASTSGTAFFFPISSWLIAPHHGQKAGPSCMQSPFFSS